MKVFFFTEDTSGSSPRISKPIKNLNGYLMQLVMYHPHII